MESQPESSEVSKEPSIVQDRLNWMNFPSFEVLTAWWGSRWKKALAKLDSGLRRLLLEEARQAVRQFEGPQGMSAPAEVLLGVGTKEESAPLKQKKEID